jgi:hypothetical protein
MILYLNDGQVASGKKTWRFSSGPRDLLISQPATLFLWGFVKEAVYVPSLSTTLDDLKNRITTAVNSGTLDILLQVWNEFSYRLDVIRAAGRRRGKLNIYKFHREYNLNVIYIVFVTSSNFEIYTYKIESIFFNQAVRVDDSRQTIYHFKHECLPTYPVHEQTHKLSYMCASRVSEAVVALFQTSTVC